MSKDKDTPFQDLGPIQRAIRWHMEEVVGLYRQLGNSPEPRAIIAGCNREKDIAFMLFRGNDEDVFKIKEFLEAEDAKQR